MFDRISNGFALARSSWGVLVRDKHLLVFPFVSGFLFLVVVASFVVPLATLVDWKQFEQQMQRNNNKPPVWTYAVLFAFYLCTYFVMIFCNAAMVSCTLLRFHGETPGVGDGFRMALARLPQIFAWAVVSATVGVLLKLVENAHEKVGEIVASLLGTAWSVMTYFVVPVLVVEKVGPVDAVGRSVSLLKQTWGEALVGKMGIGFAMFLLAIPVFLLFAVGVVVMAKGMVAVGAILLVAAFVALLLHTAIGAALSTILLTAVYQYAAEGRVPEGFDAHQMSTAFAAK